MREKGFTFEPGGEDDALILNARDAVAAVRYEDVAAVEYPSKMRKFFKGVRYGFLAAGAAVTILPYYTVVALLGRDLGS